MTARHAEPPHPRRPTAAFAAIVAALLAAIVSVAVLTVPASAVDDPTNPELVRAQTQLADCQAMRAGATNSSQRAWGDNCILLAQRWIARLSASPSPSPSSTPTASPSPTTSPSPSPSPTVSPSPSPTVSPSPSPTPSPTPTPGPTAPSGCALPLYPTPACTGTPAGWTPSTTVNGSYTTRSDGEVINGWRVTGSISVVHQNVTIRNSEVYGRIYNQAANRAYNGLLIEDVTVGPPTGNNGADTGSIGVCGYTARRVEIRNAPEGFRVGGYGYSGGRCGPVTIEDSFIKLMNVGCDHSDGISELDWRPNSSVFAHNTIDMRGVTCLTSPLYIGYGGVVRDNLLMGGAYVMRIYQWHSQALYTQVRGNRIVNNAWDGSTGPTLIETCSIIDVWRDNWLVTIDSNYAVTSMVRRLNPCAETP